MLVASEGSLSFLRVFAGSLRQPHALQPSGVHVERPAARPPRFSGWHFSRSACTTGRGPSGHKTIDGGTMAPVTGGCLGRQFILLSWVWNSTHSLCIMLKPSPFAHPHSHFCRAGQRHGTQKQSKLHRNTDSIIFHRHTSNGPSVRHYPFPQPARQTPAFKKIQFRVTAQQSWSPPPSFLKHTM